MNHRPIKSESFFSVPTFCHSDQTQTILGEHEDEDHYWRRRRHHHSHFDPLDLHLKILFALKTFALCPIIKLHNCIILVFMKQVHQLGYN